MLHVAQALINKRAKANPLAAFYLSFPPMQSPYSGLFRVVRENFMTKVFDGVPGEK